MRVKSYRTRCQNDNQTRLFPQELETNTEFWFEWQMQEIIRIQNAMLELTISELRDKRKSPQMRKEAWDWLMSDFDGPFSARLCASNNGYDIDVLRSLLKRLVTDIK